MTREHEIESETILIFADSNSMTNKVKKMPQWKEQANRYSDDQIPLVTLNLVRLVLHPWYEPRLLVPVKPRY